MPTHDEIAKETVTLAVQGVPLEVATVHRAGELVPIVFLHGFGSTKEDYVDIVRHPAFAGRPFIAYDSPRLWSHTLRRSVEGFDPFLVATAKAALERFGISDFHLVC